MKITLPRFVAVVILAQCVFLLAHPAKEPKKRDCSSCAGMTWVEKGCDFFYKYWYDSVEISDINDVPASVRKALNVHLANRLDSFAAKLTFVRGFYVNVDGYFQRNPDEKRRPSWPYTYDLHFNMRFSDDGPVDYCAQVGLGHDGRVLNEINLPRFATAPQKAALLGASELRNLAEELGVPVDKAILELSYDEREDILNYRVTFPPKDEHNEDAPNCLNVIAHDPSQFRWCRYTTVSSIKEDVRPNHRMKLPARPVTALAMALAVPGTGPDKARAAPGLAAAYPKR